MSTAFNVSKHLLGSYWDQARNTSGKGLVAILLKSGGASDTTLRDFDTVAQILSGGSVVADFTNYARKSIAGTSGTGVPAAVVNDTADNVMLDLPDLTWVDAGGGTNNTLGKLLIAFDPDTAANTTDEATLIPCLAFDLTATTDGNDLIVRFHANGAATVA